MKSTAPAFVAFALSAALAFGCTTSSETGSGGGGSSTNSAGGSGGGSGGSSTDSVNLSMTFQEYGTLSPLEGASVSFDGVTDTTDSAGKVTLTLPANTTSAIGLEQAGFPDHILYATMLDVDRAEAFDLGSDATNSAVATALSLTPDPSKGQLSVGVIDGAPGSSNRLPGATIGIDAASEAQLVFDSSAASGFSPGDTTLAGSSSASIFVNVDPGTITPTITPPSGYTCDLGPTTVEVEANGYTIVNYYCHQ
jgi:hypothetical protein